MMSSASLVAATQVHRVYRHTKSKVNIYPCTYTNIILSEFWGSIYNIPICMTGEENPFIHRFNSKSKPCTLMRADYLSSHLQIYFNESNPSTIERGKREKERKNKKKEN